MKRLLPILLHGSRGLSMLTYRDRIWKSRFHYDSGFSNLKGLTFLIQFPLRKAFSALLMELFVLKKIHFPQLKAAKNIFDPRRFIGDAYDRTGTVFTSWGQEDILLRWAKNRVFKPCLSAKMAMVKKYYGVVATPGFQSGFSYRGFLLHLNRTI